MGEFLGQDKIRCLVIGLGGGALVSYLANKFPKAEVDVVEIDPAIVRVAREQFEFADGPERRVRVVVADGVDFVRDRSESAGQSRSHAKKFCCLFQFLVPAFHSLEKENTKTNRSETYVAVAV